MHNFLFYFNYLIIKIVQSRFKYINLIFIYFSLYNMIMFLVRARAREKVRRRIGARSSFNSTLRESVSQYPIPLTLSRLVSSIYELGDLREAAKSPSGLNADPQYADSRNAEIFNRREYETGTMVPSASGVSWDLLYGYGGGNQANYSAIIGSLPSPGSEVIENLERKRGKHDFIPHKLDDFEGVNFSDLEESLMQQCDAEEKRHRFRTDRAEKSSVAREETRKQVRLSLSGEPNNSVGSGLPSSLTPPVPYSNGNRALKATDFASELGIVFEGVLEKRGIISELTQY